MDLTQIVLLRFGAPPAGAESSGERQALADAALGMRDL
jgi:hypothetical protein